MARCQSWRANGDLTVDSDRRECFDSIPRTCLRRTKQPPFPLVLILVSGARAILPSASPHRERSTLSIPSFLGKTRDLLYGMIPTRFPHSLCRLLGSNFIRAQPGRPLPPLLTNRCQWLNITPGQQVYSHCWPTYHAGSVLQPLEP